MTQPTEKLYLKDDYQKKFTTKVVDQNELGFAFDRTLFYPTCGHQQHDIGYIKTEDGRSFKVTDVMINDAGVIYHKIVPDEKEQENLTVGEKIQGEIFWPRRYYHMRLHTAQHLLSQIVEEKYDYKTVRSNFDWNSKKGGLVKIEEPLSVEEWQKVEKEAVKRIKTGLNIQRKSHEESNSIESIYEVLIDDKAPNACAGTHVRNLDEIGELAIVHVDGDKVYYEIKPRLNDKVDQIRWSYHNIFRYIPENKKDRPDNYINKLQKELDELNQENSRLAQQLLKNRLKLAKQNKKTINGVAYIFVDLSFLKLKEIRNRLYHEMEVTGSVYTVLGDKGSCAVISNVDNINARDLFERIKNHWDIHGGGSDAFAQGGPLPEQENLLKSIERIIIEKLQSNT